ncbi:YbaN family protein [Bauldia sp.]|uniref:YbaN family protein n=1 Tax=Bauldia sp. TaxID=2575872 RepID=UPI003BA9EEEE
MLSPRRAVWFAIGTMALAVGGIGVVVPVLPTTPFVILAAFAFARSAPSFARRLEASRTFGPMIVDWRAHGAIAPRFKGLAIAMMVGAFSISVALSVSTLILVIQAICMAIAAAFILSRPSGPAQ